MCACVVVPPVGACTLEASVCGKLCLNTVKMKNILLGIAVAVVIVGCVTCACRQRSVLSYNVGLTPTVPGYEERRAAVVDALETEASGADFVCLQEVWFEDDMKAILDRLGGQFPHHYSAIHYDVGQLRDSNDSKWSWIPKRLKTVPCNSLKLIKLLTCFGVKCLKSEHKPKCMMDGCQSHMYGVSQACRSCISLSASGAKDVLVQCDNLLARFNRFNSPGLLVLSKRPLSEVQYVNYHEGRKVLVERGYIKTQVKGDPTYVCTHFTSVLPHYYDVGLTVFNAYSEMQATEISQLPSLPPHLLLGDLNTGPSRNEPGRPVLKGEAPENYDLLTKDLGYRNPYMQMDGRCTYCRLENPVFRLGDNVPDSSEEVMIDHVLISPGVDNVEVLDAKRMFDHGNAIQSDHYGVQVDMCLR